MVFLQLGNDYIVSGYTIVAGKNGKYFVYDDDSKGLDGLSEGDYQSLAASVSKAASREDRLKQGSALPQQHSTCDFVAAWSGSRWTVLQRYSDQTGFDSADVTAINDALDHKRIRKKLVTRGTRGL